MVNEPADQSLNILVVDDELNVRKTLAVSLETDGHEVVAVSTGPDAIAEASRRAFDLAFVDLRLGQERGDDLIPMLLAQSPWLRIVIITAHGSIDSAVQTMRRGASDYLTKPFIPAQIRLVIERVVQLRALEQRVAGLEGLVAKSGAVSSMKSSSVKMQRAIDLAQQVAPRNTTVLICGESGTGKGVLAKAIHLWSDRAEKPFATVSCPAMSPQLLESELFGHLRGAFTGAARDNPGRIATAEGGTLFLDEIGDLPLELQPKLLRFVQDREYERVGDSITRHANVRLITATNINLEQATMAGRFREDLYYRIKVIQIDLPPLRERREDIVALANQFLVELQIDQKQQRPAARFSAQAQEALENYSWPGNIRELRNVVERAVILSRSETIGVEHLPAPLSIGGGATLEVGELISLEKLEEAHIRRVLGKTKSLDEAAEVLGVDVATLWRRRKKYGI